MLGHASENFERILPSQKPPPAVRWRTIFLGDLVDYGMFGVGVMRFARDRPNSEILLGNHEVAMLWALRDPTRAGWWISIGGQRHDLDELRKDEKLHRWMRERPALMRSEQTLIQHCGNDSYLELGDDVDGINSVVSEQLRAGNERLLWDLLSSPNIFETQPARLERYLERMRAERVVFGHKPHRGASPPPSVRSALSPSAPPPP